MFKNEVQRHVFVQLQLKTEPEQNFAVVDLKYGLLSIVSDSALTTTAEVYSARKRCFEIPSMKASTANALLDRVLPYAEIMREDTLCVHTSAGRLWTMHSKGYEAAAKIRELTSTMESDLHVWNAKQFFLAGKTIKQLVAEFGVNRNTDIVDLTTRLEKVALSSDQVDVICGTRELAECMAQGAS